MRMNGERIQEYQARRAFEVERAVATRAYQVKRELLRREGLSLPVVQVQPACTCAALPFPHIHSEEDQRRAQFRFKNRQPLVGKGDL